MSVTVKNATSTSGILSPSSGSTPLNRLLHPTDPNKLKNALLSFGSLTRMQSRTKPPSPKRKSRGGGNLLGLNQMQITMCPPSRESVGFGYLD